jgi:hypothetical protein
MRRSEAQELGLTMRLSSLKAVVNCVGSSWVQGRVRKIDICFPSVDFPDTTLSARDRSAPTVKKLVMETVLTSDLCGIEPCYLPPLQGGIL